MDGQWIEWLERRLKRPSGYRPLDFPCERCGRSCPPVHWEEVDIGVGVQVYDHVWLCPEHGEFQQPEIYGVE